MRMEVAHASRSIYIQHTTWSATVHFYAWW